MGRLSPSTTAPRAKELYTSWMRTSTRLVRDFRSSFAAVTLAERSRNTYQQFRGLGPGVPAEY